MNKRTKTPTKPLTEIDKLHQTLEALQLERLESLRQLRLGAASDVRKPTRLRRQIARELTQLRQLELAQASAEKGLEPANTKNIGKVSMTTPIDSEKEGD